MDSPYTPPATESAPPAEAFSKPPGVLRAFGIIDLLAAAYELISVIRILGILVTTEPGQQFSSQFSIRRSADHFPWMMLTSTILAAIAGVLLMLAGLQLFHRKRGSIRASNRWAIASLLAGVINVTIVAFSYLPILHSHRPPASGPDETVRIIYLSLAIPLIEMLYPTLALFLLNRPAVKRWVESYGT